MTAVCAHHWILQPPEAAIDKHVWGRCKRCYAKRDFNMTVDDGRDFRKKQSRYPSVPRPILPFSENPHNQGRTR